MTKDLISIFDLDNNLQINKEDPLILDRITQKMDLIIENKKFDYLYQREQKEEGENLNDPIPSLASREKTLLVNWKEVMTRTTLISLLSLTSYIYFKKYSDFLYKATTVKFYPQVFLFTFCVAPLSLNIYLTKLDNDILNSIKY